MVPGSGAERGIPRSEIGASDLEVQDGLAERLVLGVEEGDSRGFVAGAQAGLPARGTVFAIENASAAEESKPLIHNQAMNRTPDQERRLSASWASFSKGLTSFWGRRNAPARFTDCFTDSGPSDACNSLVRRQQELEPVVGFELSGTSHCWNSSCFCWDFKHNWREFETILP